MAIKGGSHESKQDKSERASMKEVRRQEGRSSKHKSSKRSVHRAKKANTKAEVVARYPDDSGCPR